MFALRNFASKTVQALIEESDEEDEAEGGAEDGPPPRSRAAPAAAPAAEFAPRGPPLPRPPAATAAAAEALTELHSPDPVQPSCGPASGPAAERPTPAACASAEDRSQANIAPKPAVTPTAAPPSAASTAAPSTSTASTASSPAPSELPEAPEPRQAPAPVRQPTEAEVVAVLRGQEASADQLCCDAAEARRHFDALLAVPGAAALLGSDASAEASVPRIAAVAAEALHRLSPRLLGDSSGDQDKQQLLVSFGERYDALLSRYNALQQKCREMSAQQDADGDAGQQVDAWKAAHRAATERVEEVTLENGDLRERVRLLRAESGDPREKQRLLQKLVERDAEIKAAASALHQLQEVMEDGTGAASARVAELERDLAAVRKRAQDAEAELLSGAGELQRAREASAAAEQLCTEHEARRAAAEREAAENADALEILLDEKGKYLDEREHHIDRRLVSSMVANFLDHQASGKEGLADQVISQLFRVLGSHPHASDRKRLRSASASEEGSQPATFADWLDMEMAEETRDAPGNGAAAEEVSGG